MGPKRADYHDLLQYPLLQQGVSAIQSYPLSVTFNILLFRGFLFEYWDVPQAISAVYELNVGKHFISNSLFFPHFL